MSQNPSKKEGSPPFWGPHKPQDADGLLTVLAAPSFHLRIYFLTGNQGDIFEAEIRACPSPPPPAHLE